MIRAEQPPAKSDFIKDAAGSPVSPMSFGIAGKEFSYTGSGKAAISVILRHLTKTGVIRGKMDSIHIPSWIGTAVSQTIMEHAFPVTKADLDCKIIMPYHQYGFPQNMDRVLDYASTNKAVVIEDCAHAAFGSYKGRRLGGMGDFALFSFSKFSFVRTLGGVSFSDPSFAATLHEANRKTSSLTSWALNNFKTVDEWSLSRTRGFSAQKMYLLRKMAYAVYGDTCRPSQFSISLWERKWQAEQAKRKEIYDFYRNRFARLSICDHLDESDVAPYVVPLLVKEGDAGKLADRIAAAGFETGVRKFDINRFFIEPDFRPCVVLPVHSGLGLEGAEKISKIVEQNL